jgi:hypothetical protein
LMPIVTRTLFISPVAKAPRRPRVSSRSTTYAPNRPYRAAVAAQHHQDNTHSVICSNRLCPSQEPAAAVCQAA